MSTKEIDIHVEWDGPVQLKQLKAKCNGTTDFGIYQIYGGHPVYGHSALLYIGLAADQTFAVRITRELQWLDNRDAGRIEVYLGKLSGLKTPKANEWGRQIRLVERLLIYAHAPPYNAQKNLSQLDRDLHHIHVLNWGRHRDLLPEVSGKRWSSRYSHLEISAFDDSQAWA